MKKLIALLMLFTLVFSLFSCEAIVEKPKTDEEKNQDNSENKHEDDQPTAEVFYNHEDFLAYMNNVEKQVYARHICANDYVNLDTIIPMEEFAEIALPGSADCSSSRYTLTGNGKSHRLSFSIRIIVVKTVDGINQYMDYTTPKNDIPYTSLDEIDLSNITEKGWYNLKLGEYDISYGISCDISGKYYVDTILFFIDNFCFNVDSMCSQEFLPGQEAFVKAINPEFGATDDSVIAMLNKIKALIPKS